MAAQIPLEKFIRELPDELKEEVYDYANYLLQKRLREEDRAWGAFSLTQALRGLEEDAHYTEADLKERWS
ncbi:MAG: DUF2281 domain-containing protein [Firmicutes bacterium]|jgi:hypothetical protein|nr:DUF2281 domain-containing protein [Bacillota bacterium]